MKYLIDAAIGPRDWTHLAWVMTALAVGTLLACAAAIGRDYLYAKVGSHVLNDVRLKMFDQLQRLSADFFVRARESDVLAHFSTDLAAVEGTVSTTLPYGLMASLKLAISLAVLFLFRRFFVQPRN